MAKVEPSVMHWHGAVDEGWFFHIAVSTNPENPGSDWFDKVSDEVYQQALNDAASAKEMN